MHSMTMSQLCVRRKITSLAYMREMINAEGGQKVWQQGMHAGLSLRQS